jgi:hypothetical protein
MSRIPKGLNGWAEGLKVHPFGVIDHQGNAFVLDSEQGESLDPGHTPGPHARSSVPAIWRRLVPIPANSPGFARISLLIMTFPSRDFQRIPKPVARHRLTLFLQQVPLPLLAGIGVAILVIVLLALFPGAPKFAAPQTGAQPAVAADAAPAAPLQPIAKPSPVVPKPARRDRQPARTGRTAE